MSLSGKNNHEKSVYVLNLVGTILAWISIVVFYVLFPLYVKNGYEAMASNKYSFYINTAKFAGIVFLAFFAVRFLLFPLEIIRKKKGFQSAGELILGLLIYLLAITISYALSGYKFVGEPNYFGFTEGAFYGAGSWYMGFITVTLSIVLALAVGLSLRFNDYVWIPIIWGAFVVSGLGIFNRYSIYPIEMVYASETFISTIGNIDWFGGYLSVLLPISLGLFFCSSKRICISLLGICNFVMIYACLICGADSVIAALLVTFVVLFSLSLKSADRLDRFSNILFIYLAVGIVIQNVKIFDSAYEKLTSDIANICISFGTLCLVAVISLAIKIYIWLIYEGKADYSKVLSKIVSILIPCLFLLALAVVIVLIWINTKAGGKYISSPLFFFDANWGSFRGASWNIGIKLFENATIKEKLFGVGPDCFYYPLSDNKDLTDYAYEVFWKLKLTNAHNEFLNILVNEGFVGLVAFIALCVSAIKEAYSNMKKKPVMICFLLCVVSYLTNNFFSFRQIMNTPLFFMVFGIMISALAQGGNIDKTGSKDYNF